MRVLRHRAMAAVMASAMLVLALPAAAGAVTDPGPSPSGSGTPTQPMPTGTGTATPDPTAEPSGSTTPDPTPTATTTPEPTPSPSPSTTPSTPPPTTPPTTPPPTSPPPTSPPPDPEEPPNPDDTERKDPDDAYAEALEGAQTLAVAEAQRLLQQVLGEIDGAQGLLAAASMAAEAARAADTEAQKQLQLAEQSAARTQREIDAITQRTAQTRKTLAAVANEAYQGNSLATLGVVLSAETPTELTDRYVGMRTLMRAGDAVLGDLAADQADLRNAKARLEGQRRQKQQLADEASAARRSKEATEQTAAQAQAVLADKSDKYEYALSLARQARLEDYQRYMEMINESTALGQQLAVGNYGPGYGTGTFVRPGTGSTTSEYGPRLHPILGYVKIHTGLDFGRGDGKIYAADAGTVVEAKWNNAYGNMVVVDHGEFNGQRLTTMYAHQPNLMVSKGQRVEKGQVIGSIGSTGYSTGPHLHFEVRLDGQHTDPWPWVKDAPPPR